MKGVVGVTGGCKWTCPVFTERAGARKPEAVSADGAGAEECVRAVGGGGEVQLVGAD